MYREHKQATTKKLIIRKDQKNINLPSSQSIIAKLGLNREANREESSFGGNPGYGGVQKSEDSMLSPYKLSNIVQSPRKGVEQSLDEKSRQTESKTAAKIPIRSEVVSPSNRGRQKIIVKQSG